MRCAQVKRSGPRRRSGAAVVEMAFVAPVLMMLILSSIEFGRAMMVSNMLTSASREGARIAALPNKKNEDILPTVQGRLDSSSIPSAKSTIRVKVNGVEQDASEATSRDTVTVEVTVEFGDVSWLPSPWFLDETSKMSGQAVMRRE